jgi:4,5-DOPA dioxygenase extradiol
MGREKMQMSTEVTMPAAFIGHGTPMNAIETNRYTDTWSAFGTAAPRPRVILVVSAHWSINATAVTAMPRPRTIHDFYGFPRELFEVRYEAPGLPELADEIAEVVAPTHVGVDIDSWGLDHGTWSVLIHVFPAADIPVVQLAINESKPLDYHFELGARLAPLRNRGVLIIGSGNIVHNLGAMHPGLVHDGFDWAQRFNEAAAEVLLERPAEAVGLADHADFTNAAPTHEHFIPMLYLAGLANVGEPVERMVDGYAYGSLSMASYALDSRVDVAADAEAATDSAPLPDMDPGQLNL